MSNPTDSIDPKLYYFEYDEGGLLAVFFPSTGMTTAECVKRTAKTIQTTRAEGAKAELESLIRNSELVQFRCCGVHLEAVKRLEALNNIGDK